MKTIDWLVVLVWLPLDLLAQPPDHIQMNLRLQGEQLHVQARYERRPPVHKDSLFFILNPAFTLDTIQASGLSTYKVATWPGLPFPGRILYFDKRGSIDSTGVITFKYTIDLAQSNHLKSDWIELNLDKLWFPILGNLDNPITHQTTIGGLPEAFSLTSHSNAGITYGGDKINIDQPNPDKEILILAGKDMQWSDLSGDISFFAARGTADSLLQSMHQKVSNSIDYLNRTIGSENRIEDFRVVLRNVSRSEIGFQFNRGNMIVTGPEFDDYGNLSHEIAHYWWTGADFIREPWMNESFANYSMFLVMEEFDPGKAKALLDRYSEIAKKAPPVGEATLFSENSYPAYYHKGFVLLKRLEAQIGKTKMVRLLSEMVKKDIHSTAGFLRLLGEREGTAISSEFASWLQL